VAEAKQAGDARAARARAVVEHFAAGLSDVDLGLCGKVVPVTGGGGGAGPPSRTRSPPKARPSRCITARGRRAEHAAGASATAVAGNRDPADLGTVTPSTQPSRRMERELGTVGVLVTATVRISQRPAHRTRRETGRPWSTTCSGRRSVPAGRRSVDAGGGFGRIVNIAARSGLVGVVRARSHYAAARPGSSGSPGHSRRRAARTGSSSTPIAPS
jgi:hypothetical protein